MKRLKSLYLSGESLINMGHIPTYVIPVDCTQLGSAQKGCRKVKGEGRKKKKNSRKLRKGDCVPTRKRCVCLCECPQRETEGWIVYFQVPIWVLFNSGHFAKISIFKVWEVFDLKDLFDFSPLQISKKSYGNLMSLQSSQRVIKFSDFSEDWLMH